MRVLKFGGTSLADRSRIEGVARLVSESAGRNRVVVVASAAAGTTDRLVALVDDCADSGPEWRDELRSIERRHLEILDAYPPRFRESAQRKIQTLIENLENDLLDFATDPPNRREIADRVLAVGERLSVQILAAVLEFVGCSAHVVDATDAVVTDASFGEAQVDLQATRQKCQRLFGGSNTATPIVPGFIGADRHGRTTTLGRGGSDLSAAVLGAALDAELVEIWTDVDGVMTAPPHLVPGVSSIPWLCYEEAAEMSFFGAKVLHPKTVRPLAERGIPIAVRNTLAPERRGTEIAAWSSSKSRIAAVSAVENATAIWLHENALPAPEEVLMSCRASADGTTLVAVPSSKAHALLERFQAGPHLESSIVTIVGRDIGRQPWVAGRALESLARRGIAVHGFAAGAGPHTVTLLVDRENLESAVRTVHDALLLDREAVALSGKEVRHVTAA